MTAIRDQDKVRVFISYSRTDSSLMKDNSMIGDLRSLERDNIVEFWFDENIAGGEPIVDVIKKEISKAQIALLLVSQRWLDSVFVKTNEIPLLLERAKSGELRLIPVRVSPYEDANIDWLKRLLILPRTLYNLNDVGEGTNPRISAYLEIRAEIRQAAENYTSSQHQSVHNVPQSQATILVNDARNYLKNGRISDAQFMYDRALEATPEAETTFKAHLFIEAGRCRFQTGMLPYSLKYFERALSLSSDAGDLVVKSQALSSIGNIHRAWGSLKTAEQYYNDSLRLVSDPLARIMVEMNLANAYHRLDRHGEAIILLRAALEPLREAKKFRHLGVAYGQLSLVLASEGLHPEDAFENAREGLAIAEIHDDDRGVGFAKHRVGRALFEQGKDPLALEYMESAIAVVREIGDIREIHAILIDQGEALYRIGRTEDAKRCLYGSMMIGAHTADVFRLGQSHYCLGRIQSANKQSAVYFFNVAKRLFQLCRAEYRVTIVAAKEEDAQVAFPDGVTEVRERTTLYLKSLGLRIPFSQSDLLQLIANT